MSFPRNKFTKKKMGTTMSGANNNSNSSSSSPAANNKPAAPQQQQKANYNILNSYNAAHLLQQQQKAQVIAKTPQEKCNDMLAELEKLEKDVEAFEGTKNDKVFLKLEELLTRCLLKLDEIDRGDEQINLNRKKLINYTHTLTDKLEGIAASNASKVATHKQGDCNGVADAEKINAEYATDEKKNEENEIDPK